MVYCRCGWHPSSEQTSSGGRWREEEEDDDEEGVGQEGCWDIKEDGVEGKRVYRWKDGAIEGDG